VLANGRFFEFFHQRRVKFFHEVGSIFVVSISISRILLGHELFLRLILAVQRAIASNVFNVLLGLDPLLIQGLMKLLLRG